MALSSLDLGMLAGAAFFAGLVDAVVGGGGLVQIPALFGILPPTDPTAVFGTNKLSSVFGTAFATARYSRRIQVPWRVAGPAALAALFCSFLGARAVALMPREVLRPLVLVLLVAMTLYTFARKDLGAADQGRKFGRGGMLVAALVGAALGFYDGFFGPGTGSFLIFAFVRLFGLDFLRASVAAKIVNVTTNLAALSFFAASGHVLYRAGLIMAALNVCGSAVGSHLALHHGSGFVRRVFLAVAAALIAKFAYDTLWH